MTQRGRRSGVEDRWTTKDGKPSANHGKGSRWRARYVDDQGREHAKGFALKGDARKWLDGQTAAVVDGRHIAPRDAQMTVQQWCDLWLQGYAIHRESTVDEARKCIRHIVAEFGDVPLSAVRPSQVKAWTVKLTDDGFAANYVYQLHKRLSQILGDAVHDGVLPRNPCSRRTSPPRGTQKPYVATTEQVWQLHDAMPENLRVAVLLGAFVGLRVGEVCGLKVADVNFMRGIVTPHRQWGDRPLKTAGSEAPIPIPQELALMLSASVQRFGTDMMVTDSYGKPCGPWTLKRAIGEARGKVDGLPDTFSYHDLRHYFASMLIASGADVKTIQARLRHASAMTTLDTYGHLFKDADESTRAAIASVIASRPADEIAR
jgi:integrase